MVQHIKSRAKSLNPLGGKAELREGKDSHTLATFHVKRRQNVKTLGNFYYSKIVIILKSCDIGFLQTFGIDEEQNLSFFWLFLRGILKCCTKAWNQMR